MKVDITKIIVTIIALLIVLSLFQTFQLVDIQSKISVSGYTVQTQLTTSEVETPTIPAQRGGC